MNVEYRISANDQVLRSRERTQRFFFFTSFNPKDVQKAQGSKNHWISWQYLAISVERWLILVGSLSWWQMWGDGSWLVLIVLNSHTYQVLTLTDLQSSHQITMSQYYYICPYQNYRPGNRTIISLFINIINILQTVFKYVHNTLLLNVKATNIQHYATETF